MHAVWSSMDVEKYLDEIFMESVYRATKEAIKSSTASLGVRCTSGSSSIACSVSQKLI
jgi:hypothetical protein